MSKDQVPYATAPSSLEINNEEEFERMRPYTCDLMELLHQWRKVKQQQKMI